MFLLIKCAEDLKQQGLEVSWKKDIFARPK